MTAEGHGRTIYEAMDAETGMELAWIELRKVRQVHILVVKHLELYYYCCYSGYTSLTRWSYLVRCVILNFFLSFSLSLSLSLLFFLSFFLKFLLLLYYYNALFVLLF